MYDVIIVGAGPAGLSAALVLGRCRRTVLVCDDGQPRNARAGAIHGYLTRDGTAPSEFLQLARRDLEPYSSVSIETAHVESAARRKGSFTIKLDSGETREARRLLLATGVVDEIPPIEGIEAFYGASIHHCPYCDGWESRDQIIVAYGKGAHVFGLAMTLRNWTDKLLVCSDGPSLLEESDRATLARHGISLREDRIARLEGRGDQLERIIFEEGDPLPCDALFFSTGQRQHSSIAADFGCEFSEKGAVLTGHCETTNVPGLFVAGDASKATQFVIVAAAEGAEAAGEINRSLEEEDRIPG